MSSALSIGESQALAAWLAEAVKVFGLGQIEDVPHQWFWDGHEHMDPLKDAPWDVYLVAARLRIAIDGEALGEVDIARRGLIGLYRDDVYDVVVR